MVSKHFAISIHKIYEKFCLCSTSLNLNAFTSISDVDECETRSYSCHSHGQCVNLQGSYDCTCLNGYTGDGSTSCSGM